MIMERTPAAVVEDHEMIGGGVWRRKQSEEGSVVIIIITNPSTPDVVPDMLHRQARLQLLPSASYLNLQQNIERAAIKSAVSILKGTCGPIHDVVFVVIPIAPW